MTLRERIERLRSDINGERPHMHSTTDIAALLALLDEWEGIFTALSEHAIVGHNALALLDKEEPR